jgi:hypothetical protein
MNLATIIQWDALMSPGGVMAGWAIVAFGAWVTLRWVRWRAVNRGDHPLCPGCGYAAVGITAGRCPECGVDFVLAGVVPPGGRRPIQTATRIAQWTMLLPLAAVAMVEILAANGTTFGPRGDADVTQCSAYDPGPRGWTWVILATALVWALGVRWLLYRQRRRLAGLQRGRREATWFRGLRVLGAPRARLQH